MKKPFEASQQTPEGLDWDLWLGPAPIVPFNIFYHNHKDPVESNFAPWNRFRIFGGGNVADWGSHIMGGLLWGCDLDNTGPVEITAWPDRPVPPNNVEPILEYTFASGFRILHKFADPKCASMIYLKGDLGDTSYEGWKKLDRAKVQAVKVLDYKEQGEPPRDFIHCIRTGNKKTFRNPESVHRVGTALHLGNISYVLGGRKIRFDPEKEQIVGDDEANALLTRTYRDPWGLNG